MRQFSRLLLVGLALLAPIGVAPNAAFAQESRATITGTVTDSSAAVIPAAAVEATNTATGVVARTVANETGNFRIPYLNPGRYRVTAGKSGFKLYVHPDIELGVAQTVELKVTLQVGETTERVQIIAGAELLQTTEARQSATIGDRKSVV